jgi:hypothetical protein
VRIAAPLRLFGHPRHVAVGAGLEETAQPLPGKRDRIRPRNAHNIEILPASKSGERGFQL